MATLVGVLNTSHVWVGRPAENWSAVRAARDLRPDVPEESIDEQRAKAARIAAGTDALKSKLAELRPDVIIIFGDDQSENFPAPALKLVPQITIFAGEEFHGLPYERQDATRGSTDKSFVAVPGHPELATAILYGLIDQGFDPAYSLEIPNLDRGIGHAIMNPVGYFTDYTIPVVPVILNAIFAPSITAKRSYQIGRAIRTIVENYPQDLRVVAIGSGGLWHTTSAPQSWVNEEFDQQGLRYLETGDLAGWAAHFDGYDTTGDRSQEVNNRTRGSSGFPAMPGPQYGTRETLDWIAASSMADGSPFTVLDFIPIYSSPINASFAYCDDIRPL